MGKQFCLKLLIVSSLLGQGTVVSSEENIDSSSDLLIRQKRASSTGSNEVVPHHNHEKKFRLVHVVSGEEHFGIGVVVHPRVIATRASIFRAGVNYQVMFAKPDGDYERLALYHITPNPLYAELHEGPLGAHDVALAVSAGDLPKSDFVINDISAAKFTVDQARWIFQTLPTII